MLFQLCLSGYSLWVIVLVSLNTRWPWFLMHFVLVDRLAMPGETPVHRQQYWQTQFLDDFEFFAHSSRFRLLARGFTGQNFPLVLAIWFSEAPFGCLLRYIRVLVFLFDYPSLLSLGDFPLRNCWCGARPPLVLTPLVCVVASWFGG